MRRAAIPWMFLIPALVLATVFKFAPMFSGVWMSVNNVRPFLGDEFVGFKNYIAVIGDPTFQNALGHTLILGFGETLGSLAIGVVLALLLEGSALKLKIVRTAVFFPVVTAVAVVAEIWRVILFPTETGFLNSILHTFGIGTQQFLSDPKTALMWILIAGIWSGAPYSMVIILAGLVSIDRTLYEAVSIDGGGTWRRLWSIVLPALRPAIGVLLTLAAIRSLRIFTDVYVLTGGGPAGATEVWMTRTFTVGFNNNQLGLASAASVLLLLATLILTLGVQAFNARKGRS